MVQVIENAAELQGTLIEIRIDPTRPNRGIVVLDVSEVHSVENLPNLLAELRGTRVEVRANKMSIESLVSGQRVRCRARRSGPTTVFAESFGLEIDA